jgi:hypothetical protein
VSRWQDEITCAVLTGVSNARSESLNRIAELEARMAYSFRNPATPQPPRPHRMQPRPAITDNNYKTTTPRDRPEARPRSTSKSLKTASNGTKRTNVHQNILSDRVDIPHSPKARRNSFLAVILLRRLVIYGQKGAVRGG